MLKVGGIFAIIDTNNQGKLEPHMKYRDPDIVATGMGLVVKKLKCFSAERANFHWAAVLGV